MRYADIAGGLKVYLSIAEEDILDKIKNGKIEKSKYSKDENQVINILITKNVVRRERNDKGKIIFKLTKEDDNV